MIETKYGKKVILVLLFYVKKSIKVNILSVKAMSFLLIKLKYHMTRIKLIKI